MSRPQDNKAPWMRHREGLRNNRRIKAFRAKHGVEGYGLLNMLLEALMSSDYCCLFLTDEEIDLLSGDFYVDASKLKEIIDSLVSLKLFAIENGVLTCMILDQEEYDLYNDRGRPLLEYRQKYIQGQRPNSNSEKIREDQKTGDQRKEEEKKGEKRRLEKTPVSSPETHVTALETCSSAETSVPTLPGETSKASFNVDDEKGIPQQFYDDLKKLGIDPTKPLKALKRAARNGSSGSDEMQTAGDIMKPGL